MSTAVATAVAALHLSTVRQYVCIFLALDVYLGY